MALPLSEQNGVFTHVYPVGDLGLTPTGATIVLGSSATVTGTVFSTGVPATVVVIAKLSSGAGTLNVQVVGDGVSPTFSGGDNTAITLTGTGYVVGVVDTSFTYDDSSPSTTTISVDKRFVATQIVDGGSGMTITKLALLVMYELTPGEDWFLGLRGSANAVANRTVGDGSGKVYLGPVATSNPYLNPNLIV